MSVSQLAPKWLLIALASAAAAGCDPGVSTALDMAAAGDLLTATADLVGAPDLATPPAMAITAPRNTWTWVDFPDSVCDDGTPTGIGVKLTDSKNLLIFMNGGGACWDYLTCAILNTSTHGPFGAPQWNALAGANLSASILGDAVDNPWAGWNMVFVPYCTGDLHAGTNVATYMGPGNATKVIHHKGHDNVVAYLERLVATIPNPERLVVSGSSAGGFGAALNYDTARAVWPNVPHAYLLDDSGPSLIGDAIPMSERAAFFASWNLGALIGAKCPTCTSDLSALVPALIAAHPNDRMALLETLQDQTISTYFQLAGPQFQVDLLAMASMRLDAAPNFHYFFEPGAGHTMLGNYPIHSSNGVPLKTWLAQFATDDAAWKSTKP